MRRTLAPELRDWVELVVADNADDLLRYFRRRVDQPEDAADLLGRVLLTLWEKASRIPMSDEEARMWCFGIARNVIREHYRGATKRISLANALRDQLTEPKYPDNSADTTADARLQAQAVRKAVAHLDERSRELVTLVHWDGFNIAQAARLLAINESTARTRYGRALQRLRRDLDDQSSSEEIAQARARPDMTHASRHETHPARTA